MLLKLSETVVRWIHYHTDSVASRSFNLKICSNMSVNGRLPISSCGNHFQEKKKNVWTAMQDAFANLIVLLLHMTYSGSWRTENSPFPFPQLQHVTQNQSSG